MFVHLIFYIFDIYWWALEYDAQIRETMEFHIISKQRITPPHLELIFH